jgi:hypothetical protein
MLQPLLQQVSSSSNEQPRRLCSVLISGQAAGVAA